MEFDIKVQEQLVKAIESISSTSWHESPALIALVSGCLTLLGAWMTFFFNKKAEKQRIENEFSLKRIELDNMRKEHIQNDQLAALKALSQLSYNLRPNIWRSPDYDANEAYTDVVIQMGSFLDELDRFSREHRFALPSREFR